MGEVAAAYVPVLHEGYRRFVERHATATPFYVIGPELYADYRPLAKDIRALPADVVAASIRAWGICSEVTVLTAAGAAELAAQRPTITLPAEDVSYQVVEAYFPRCEVRFDTVFLRWDKTKTVQLLEPRPVRTARPGDVASELRMAAESAARQSTDWWRRVGAAIALPSGAVRAATNVHGPHPLAPYVVGDPRSNFFQGVHLELSTAVHAEAALIADAARRGEATEGATLYVTDFPCPPCARLIAGAGIVRVMYADGYATLDGHDVLTDAGVEIVAVGEDPVDVTDADGVEAPAGPESAAASGSAGDAARAASTVP